MDLVPTPGQVVSAVGNAAGMLLSGGLADLRPQPRALVAQGEGYELHHYLAETDDGSAAPAPAGDPVLLVSPLAAPPLCYDLRRGCSLVEHLVGGGRPTYLVEYGTVSLRDRSIGLEQWVEGVLPAAVAEASRHAGDRPVHLVGWSLGGTFSLLTAADRPDLPIASVTALGSPFDVRKVPIVAPVRPVLDLAEPGGAVSQVVRAYRALGGPALPVLQWAFDQPTVQRLVARPLAVAQNLDDAEFLAQLEAVDRFVARTSAYPGRTFGQLYHRFLGGRGLHDGEIEVGDRCVRLADLTAPVLLVGGLADEIVPIAAVRPGVELLSGSAEVRFEMVPGGHLGMLTGRGAAGSTWQALDDWLDERLHDQ